MTALDARTIMTALDARSIASAGHHQSRDRHGGLIIEHVERVAAAMPPEAETVAWLHDLLEKTSMTLDELCERGLDLLDSAALALLTRLDDESYEAHVLRIAFAPGPAGRLARMVKLADLDDHLRHAWACGDPPYHWARLHVGYAVERDDRLTPFAKPGPPMP